MMSVFKLCERNKLKCAVKARLQVLDGRLQVFHVLAFPDHSLVGGFRHHNNFLPIWGSGSAYLCHGNLLPINIFSVPDFKDYNALFGNIKDHPVSANSQSLDWLDTTKGLNVLRCGRIFTVQRDFVFNTTSIISLNAFQAFNGFIGKKHRLHAYKQYTRAGKQSDKALCHTQNNSLDVNNERASLMMELNTPIARAAKATGLHFSCQVAPHYGGGLLNTIPARGIRQAFYRGVKTPATKRVINSPKVVFFNASDRGRKMTSLFSTSDINTTINHEPRVHDLLLASKLGYERPRVIREIIERNKEELEAYGSLAVRHGKSRGQEFVEYFLNEGQSLCVATLSRTDKAPLVRKGLIDVFMAVRHEGKKVTVRQHERVLGKAKEQPEHDAYDLKVIRDNLEGVERILLSLMFGVNWSHVTNSTLIYPQLTTAEANVQSVKKRLMPMLDKLEGKQPTKPALASPHMQGLRIGGRV